MLDRLRKYESVQPLIERCNRMVLDVLATSEIREAKIAAESFKNGGKRLRPMLMMLASMATNGRSGIDRPVVQLAAAVELIHLATLFHDDVIDEVESRRMSMSARAKYGNFVSVLAGDYVLSEALLLVQRSGEHHTMPDFLRTIRVLVSGESRETNHKFDFDMSESTYHDIISEKSASLFFLSCKAGAMVHHSPHADALGDFGWNLGMAFQMIDDLDDMLGLTNGSMDCDLANGYLALPVIHLLSGGEHRDRLVDMIKTGEFSEDDEREIVGLCVESGAFRRAKKTIDRRLDDAGEKLSGLESNPAVSMLQDILTDLRDYARGQVKGLSTIADGRRDRASDAA